MNDLNTLSIKEARTGLLAKKFSSLELSKACLSRIEEKDKILNSFITVCGKEALIEALEADKKIARKIDLPLLGVPIALKDIYLTKGIRTTAASKVLDNYIPQYSATVVNRLKEAGAIILGKTNLDAWAHGSSGENSDFGATKNPWDLTKTPGGSSSGSAVCVSASMALVSMGTDTAGSVRLPASFTNTVGLKPTYGRVSRYGVIAMGSSLDTMGHFTKTVEDSALVLSVTAGKDEFDVTTLPNKVPNYLENAQKRNTYKIGIAEEYFTTGVDQEIIENIEKAIKVLESLGYQRVKITLPHTQAAIATYYIIMSSEVSSNLERYDGIRFGDKRDKFADEAKRRIMLGTYILSSGYYDQYYLKASKVRTLIRRDFEDAFSKVDMIIGPVSPSLPFNLGEKVNNPLSMYLSDVFTAPINLAGLPALAVPCGFSKSGLPIGMQIIGPQLSEDLLFNIGFHYQEKTDWHKKQPNL